MEHSRYQLAALGNPDLEGACFSLALYKSKETSGRISSSVFNIKLNENLQLSFFSTIKTLIIIVVATATLAGNKNNNKNNNKGHNNNYSNNNNYYDNDNDNNQNDHEIMCFNILVIFLFNLTFSTKSLFLFSYKCFCPLSF
jgi:hypothetical protein